MSVTPREGPTARVLADDLSWGVQARAILDGVTLGAAPGELVGLLGPNGSGKSSLLRAVAGVRRVDAGTVLLDGEDVTALGRRAVARRVALVEQESSTEVDLRVRDVVDLGRIPHRDRWGAAGPHDTAAVGAAMDRVGVAHLAHRRWSTLSGGERQRTHLARALAQQPGCLLLDEPTNHLDVRHQLELFALLAGAGVTCVAALHDLPLAARHCDRLVVMDGGRVVADGAPVQALTEGLIARVYGVRATVTPLASPHGGAGAPGRAQVVYTGLLAAPAAG